VAVAEAHALGIVHRDLKPANLFCVRRSDGQLSIKVLDFGISKMTDTSALNPGAMTRTSAMMGSPFYMSPEQMRSAKDVDTLTDIWALGVIIFELLTGRHAFQAESVTELAIKVNGEPMPSIRNLRVEVPSALEAVVGTCLEKDRRRRYRNVAELSLALMPFAPKRSKSIVERISGIIQGGGDAPPGPASPGMVETQTALGTLPPLGRTGLGSTGGKKVVLGVAGAGAVLAVVGGVALLRWSPDRRASAPAAAPQAASLPVSSHAVSPGASSPAPPQVLPAELATGTDARPPDPLRADSPLPPVASTALALSTATLPVTRKKTPSSGGATPPATSVVVETPLPPTGAKCDPPYYFDAKGNRIFKKECL
jgi:serine/threonine-protein kinase